MKILKAYKDKPDNWFEVTAEEFKNHTGDSKKQQDYAYEQLTTFGRFNAKFSVYKLEE